MFYKWRGLVICLPFEDFQEGQGYADPAPDLAALKLYLSELKLPSLTDNDA